MNWVAVHVRWRLCALTLTLGGCFSPDWTAAECLPCPEGLCPGDLICRDDRCVLPGSTKSCSQTETGGSANVGGEAGNSSLGGHGSGGRFPKGTGGAGSSDPGDGGTAQSNGGSPPTAGAAGGGTDGGTNGDSGGGAGGPGGAGGGNVQIDPPDTKVACTGQVLHVTVSAAGGSAPYRWELLEGDGLALSPISDSEASVHGSPALAGELAVRVKVTDDTGHSDTRAFAITVATTPVVKTTSIPSACTDEVYSAPLEAEGGDESQYHWSLDIPADAGFAVNGNRIEGTLPKPLPDSPISLAVSVDDGTCASESQPLSLQPEPQISEVCPKLIVATSPLLEPAPPCLNQPYKASIQVSGVSNPSSPNFEEISTPEGLSVDVAPSKLEVTGIARGSGPLSLSLRGDNGRLIRVSYDLEAREKCWFGYVYAGAQPSRLRLFDPLLGNRKEFPDENDTRSVTDFAFSPDGRFLAYRLTSPSEPRRLALVNLADYTSQALEPGNVNYYTWSDDSSTLAMVFDSEAGQQLGGVKLEASGTSGMTVSKLGATSTDIQAPPIWLDGNVLGFLAFEADDSILGAGMSALGTQGFSAPDVAKDVVSATAVLRRAPGALFVLAAEPSPVALYYPVRSTVGIWHGDPDHGDIVVAPSGGFVGRVDGGALSLFRANERSYEKESPRPTLPGCDTILSWSSAQERLACVHQTADHANELWIVDVTPNSGAMTRLPAVRGDFTYREGQSIERRRVFSPQGDKLAFTTDDALYVAFFTDGTPVVKYRHPLVRNASNHFAELLFSPDGRLLLMRQGSSLNVIDVANQNLGIVELRQDMNASQKCNETFLRGNWCGGPSVQTDFLWSPDSRLAAFRTATDDIGIYDISWLAQARSVGLSPEPVCQANCVKANEFAFQP